ncbi:MAG: hypothetical protein ACOVMQ_10405 [Cyclobacteriaceae bacterium]
MTLLVTGLASCSKESPLSEQSKALATTSQQKWVLVKMSGGFGIGATTGSAMQWQEYYVFNNDGTFSRNRQQDNATKSATGTFTTVTESDQQFLELTYTGGDDLKTSCYPKERLLNVSADLLKGTWGHCDGPTLEYAKANETGQ